MISQIRNKGTTMDIQTIAIGNINPAIYNPRRDLQPGDWEYDILAKVLGEFDLVELLVWNKPSGNKFPIQCSRKKQKFSNRYFIF